MDTVKDLDGKNYVEKIKSLLINNPKCMLIVPLDSQRTCVCPMNVKSIDENGNIWFLSHKESEHFEVIQEKGDVLLTFANYTDKEYLSITGVGVHYDSKDLIDKFWDNEDVQCFKKGKNDSDIVALKVSVVNAYCWDITEQKSIAI
ncbi:pyridoxamine 5'-phosphate oxidase family protein [Tenacibaculum sp. IB213877]|uniref:pyridoxamine 5'-phosphate oxidase family protein n=1 Tax=Tenacibaculum sp. IB213877 TaxID=3097351 RepID=UPI002A5A28DF|nr:pyridoxamine 5'-phosphate oxidase family protein [Tenacibaculum sp. IB213877]MDY0780121.1 pyridoxamine 5'-phosphate oxidase family protein [Tenacibaculum sp. IB213877]